MAASRLEPFTHTASGPRPLPGMAVPGNQPATFLPEASWPYSRQASVREPYLHWNAGQIFKAGGNCPVASVKVGANL